MVLDWLVHLYGVWLVFAGTCGYSTGSQETWYTADCTCELGYTGADCSIDEDGCSGSPCYDLCSDVAASTVSLATIYD